MTHRSARKPHADVTADKRRSGVHVCLCGFDLNREEESSDAMWPEVSGHAHFTPSAAVTSPTSDHASTCSASCLTFASIWR